MRKLLNNITVVWFSF